jgi:putative ABC transport system ATP-binding protein
VKQLDLEDGRRVCLVGGSGSGKTTLLHVLAGIVTPTKGEVRYGDVDITKLAEAERDRFRAKNVGYVFQSFNLLQGLSALENVAIAGTFGGQGGHEARDRAAKLLDRVGLSHRKDARPGTMSVGEQQRVGIARALVNRPKVVLADEPTASLDDERADEVLALLEEVVKEEKATLVLVTHEQRVRERFDDVLDLKELGR